MKKALVNLPRIDRESAIPFYFQLKDAIYTKIKTGEWKRGQKIPSLRELSDELKISLMTVRQAMKALVDEKVLTMQKGLGTFILGPRVKEKVSNLSSYTAEMLRQGLMPSSRILTMETISAPSNVRDALELQDEEKVHHLFRVRLADHYPMALQHSYVPERYCPALSQKDLSGSLLSILETDYDLQFFHAVQTISADQISGVDAERLDLPDRSSVLRMERTSYAQDQKPCEFLISIYRADRFNFTVEVDR
jgi:GntR family transcriptional regulator